MICGHEEEVLDAQWASVMKVGIFEQATIPEPGGKRKVIAGYVRDTVHTISDDRGRALAHVTFVCDPLMEWKPGETARFIALPPKFWKTAL